MLALAPGVPFLFPFMASSMFDLVLRVRESPSFVVLALLVGMPVRLDCMLKFSMPVMCIFIVLGLPARSTWLEPVYKAPPCAEWLVPELVD
jgi:hypothetical protein